MYILSSFMSTFYILRSDHLVCRDGVESLIRMQSSDRPNRRIESDALANSDRCEKRVGRP